MVGEALKVRMVEGRSERVVDSKEMWYHRHLQGTTPESVVLLRAAVMVAQTTGRPVEAKE